MLKLNQLLARRGRAMRTLANVAEGHRAGGAITRVASAALTSKFLLVKPHTTAGEVAICGVSDIPMGVATDEAALGDYLNVQLFGCPSASLRAVASATISEGAWITPAANGQVRALPATPGTYWVVGRALSTAAANGFVEFDPCLPRAQTV